MHIIIYTNNFIETNCQWSAHLELVLAPIQKRIRVSFARLFSTHTHNVASQSARQTHVYTSYRAHVAHEAKFNRAGIGLSPTLLLILFSRASRGRFPMGSDYTASIGTLKEEFPAGVIVNDNVHQGRRRG